MRLSSSLKQLGAVCFAVSVTLGVTAVPAAAQTAAPEAPAPAAQDQVEQPTQRAHSTVDTSKPAKRFIVKFQENMATLDDAKKNQIIQEVLNEFSPATPMNHEHIKVAFDGSWVVEMNPPVPGDQVINLRAKLESKAEIAYADIDKFVRYNPNAEKPQNAAAQDGMNTAKAVPNDPEASKQWHLDQYPGANVYNAWDLGSTGSGVNIAVIDSGITQHPDLDGKRLPGVDMISDPKISHDYDGRDNDPNDNGDWTEDYECNPTEPGTASSWHGSHVAGIAAAATNNNTGVAGVAPDAKIVPIRALGACGGYTSDIADGLVWAAGETLKAGGKNPTNFTLTNPNPAKVINLSLGGDGQCNPLYQTAIAIANARGASVLIAAGNENEPSAAKDPANCPGAIAVGANGPEGYRARYSNYDDQGQIQQVVDFTAPGGNMAPNGWANTPINPDAGIYSTVNKGLMQPTTPGYDMMQGTSMATPVAAGVVALMLQANPNLAPARIEQILKDTAKPFQTEPNEFGNASYKTQGSGAGIIDAQAAVCQSLKDAGKSCGAAITTPATTAPVSTTANTTAPVSTVTSTAPVVTATKTVTTTVTGGKTTVTATTTVEPAPITTTSVKLVPTTLTETTTVNGVPSTITTTKTVPTTVTTTQTEPAATTTVHSTVTTTAKPVTLTKEIPTTVNGTPTTVTSTETITEAPVTTTKLVPTTIEKTTTVNGVPSTVTETAEVTTTIVGAPVTTTQQKTSTVVLTSTVNGKPTTVTEVVTDQPTVTVAPTTTTATVTATEVVDATETITETSTETSAPVAPPVDREVPKAKSSGWILPLMIGGLIGALLNGPTWLAWAKQLNIPTPFNDSLSSFQRNLLGAGFLFGGIGTIIAAWLQQANDAGSSTN